MQFDMFPPSRTMGRSDLNLDSPAQHNIISNCTNEVHSQPIYGTVTLDGLDQAQFAKSSLLHICLVGVISIADRNIKDFKSHRENWLTRFDRWFLASHKLCRLEARPIRSCSVIEQLTIRRPFESGKGNTICTIPFCLPIDNIVPGTLVTDLGKISYHLLATLQTADGTPFQTASREISITHQICPERPSIQHIRNYSGRHLITNVIMTQDLDSTTRAKIPITVDVFVRPARPADRIGEYRCIAIRGVRWRVEEITDIFKVSKNQQGNGQDPEPAESKSSTCVISKGLQKGYWKTSQTSRRKEHSPQNSNPSVNIPLEISLKRGIVAPSEVDLDAYNSFYKSTDRFNHTSIHEKTFPTIHENLIITIKHRLKLNIMSFEDTFCAHKHTLVDRMPLPTALDALFPLQIIQRPSADMNTLMKEASPPHYEEISISPPRYTGAKPDECVI